MADSIKPQQDQNQRIVQGTVGGLDLIAAVASLFTGGGSGTPGDISAGVSNIFGAATGTPVTPASTPDPSHPGPATPVVASKPQGAK